MALIAQTVTIVNKSGKVVGTSKHLVNVFNEAKSAYAERKAELKAFRRGNSDRKDDERKTRKRLETLTLDDDDTSSRRSSRRGSEDGRSSVHRKPVSRRERPPIERGVSDSFYTNDHPASSTRKHERRHSNRPSPLRHESSSSAESDPHLKALARRHTDLELTPARPSNPTRRASADDIDMDLAYGELPPPLPERNYDTEIELRQKMSGLQRLLDECNCLQHSATAIIDNLQKNPDALAAVALTLAEISNLATKLAPGALMAMKGSFPAIITLLAAPEFAIAVGVGVGVTIIALGGYKIIKKIKARKEAEAGNLLEANPGAEEPETPEGDMDSLREISRIEMWRRGIADEEAQSAGMSVDGEFVTPQATKTLMMEGKLTEADLKAKEGKKKKKHRSSKSEKGSKTSSSGTKVKSKKEGGGIRMLFKGGKS
jgi:hypothetical protein